MLKLLSLQPKSLLSFHLLKMIENSSACVHNRYHSHWLHSLCQGDLQSTPNLQGFNKKCGSPGSLFKPGFREYLCFFCVKKYNVNSEPRRSLCTYLSQHKSSCSCFSPFEMNFTLTHKHTPCHFP